MRYLVIRTLSTLAAAAATLAASLSPASAALVDWHVIPGATSVASGSYDNWTPYASTNLNNSNAQTSGSANGISYSIWDGYGPHGNAVVGSNHNIRDFGGQQFDVKALYARSDANTLYIGIVSGFNPNGVIDPYDSSRTITVGDLAINPDWSHHTAALAVDILAAPYGSSGNTSLYSGGSWTVPDQSIGFAPNPYSNFTTSTATRLATNIAYSYTNLGITYADPVTNANTPIGLMEFAIPRNDLTLPSGATLDLSYAMSCSNDSLTLSHTLYTSPGGGGTPVPEPTSIALLAFGGTLLLLRHRKPRSLPTL